MSYVQLKELSSNSNKVDATSLNVQENPHGDGNDFENKIELSKRKACTISLILASIFLAMILGIGFTSYKIDQLQKELNTKSITNAAQNDNEKDLKKNLTALEKVLQKKDAEIKTHFDLLSFDFEAHQRLFQDAVKIDQFEWIEVLLNTMPKATKTSNSLITDYLFDVCKYHVSKSVAKVVKLLIEKGANVTARDEHQNTPLHWACTVNNFDAVKTIIQNGAEVNAKDEQLWTPLHEAVASGNFEIVKYLVSAGADVIAKDVGGRLPIDVTEDAKFRQKLKNILANDKPSQ